MSFFRFDSFEGDGKKRGPSPSDSDSSEAGDLATAELADGAGGTTSEMGAARVAGGAVTPSCRPLAGPAADPPMRAHDPEPPFETVAALAASAGEDDTTAVLVQRFVFACRREWQESAKDDADRAKVGKGSAQEVPPEQSLLQPLVDVAFAMALDANEERHLRDCCLHSLGGEHLLAQKSYIDLVIGSKKWVTGGLLYISSDEPKGNERMWGQKYRRIEEKGSLLDDAALQKALQGFKRLLSWMEGGRRRP